MLLNLVEILKVAKENKFAVGAFNITELSNFKSVVETAEKLKSPAIIAVAVGEFKFCGKNFYSYIVNELKQSRIPFCLHLDHGDSAKVCLEAITAGFTSVMIDASHLPFEENIRITKEVVKMADLVGVSVEGELGTIGDLEFGAEKNIKEIVYTQPSEAKQFIEKTGVDALAIAVGTSHGLYPSGFKPKLQLKLLEDISTQVHVPLVLHGGSGQDDEQIKKAINLGISKINIASEYKSAITNELVRIVTETGEFKFANLLPKAITKGKQVIESKMELFGSVNKAHLYE